MAEHRRGTRNCPDRCSCGGHWVFIGRYRTDDQLVCPSSEPPMARRYPVGPNCTCTPAERLEYYPSRMRALRWDLAVELAGSYAAAVGRPHQWHKCGKCAPGYEPPPFERLLWVVIALLARGETSTPCPIRRPSSPLTDPASETKA